MKAEEARLIEAGIAESTRKTYQTGLRKFREFLSGLGQSVTWPVSVQQVRSFIAFLSLKGFSQKTAANYVAGIAYEHKINDMVNPVDNFIVRKMLEGFKRFRQSKDTREPITIAMLQAVSQALPWVCSNPFETALFQAAMLLGYFGFLRISEYTAKAKTRHDRALQLKDIHIAMDGSVAIHISRSKTDQAGKGAGIIIEPCSIKQICPGRALQNYLNNFRPGGGGTSVHSC